jgi:predicted LPLAT superfamily acyltransferase
MNEQAPAALPPKQSAWLRAAELGSVLGIRIVLGAATLLGRAPMRGLLAIIVLYYALAKRGPRQASREYLTRMGQPSGFWAVYGHLLRFAQCAADRIFLIAGKTSLFEIHTHGAEHLVELQRQKRGAILLSAHLGSFEALHAQAGRDAVMVNVVGYFRNAQRINRVLERLGSTVHARLLEPRPGIEFALQLRDCLERGELVGVLGDRSIDGKTVEVDFLGSPARFPTGAFALAAAMRCPVLITFALHTPPNRYDLYCEPLVEQVVLPRKEREAALRAHVQAYAERLEHYCRMRPDNWFNFYDFWSKSG